MAEYLIQSETLDDIADAINAKTGGSSAMTPAEMAAAIGSISDGGVDYLEGALDNTLTEYRNESLLVLGKTYFASVRSLINLFLPNASVNVNAALTGNKSIRIVVVAKLNAAYIGQTFQNCTALQKVDFTSNTYLTQTTFFNCAALETIILRGSSVASFGSASGFNGSPFASGGTGGTIYIPKALYDHLGDGTSLDYKAATNWSTIDGYGTITWAQIEGSQYENYYADGTPIPSE